MLPDMRIIVAAATICVLAAPAPAGPTARFGLTYGLHDPEADAATPIELGPMVTFGYRLGPIVAEGEWAYLSFFDPEASSAGVHRLGVTLRADLVRRVGPRCWRFYDCTHATGLYAEAGAAEKYGRWQVDADRTSPIDTPQSELHLGVGLELNNRVWPRRDGWQLGLRLAFSPADAIPASACRGNCPVALHGGGTQEALLVEWMFLIGE
jgi:hypothetical protein